MKRYGKEVRLFFDMDSAGQKAARKSAALALEKELEVTIVSLPTGKDAADIGKDNAEKLRQVVAAATPALSYFLTTSLTKHDLATPSGKRQIVDDYAELLQIVKNPIERSEAIKDLARAIEMDERLITGVVNKLFLEQTRRDGPAPLRAPEDPWEGKHTFGKRSELLREELIALMYAERSLTDDILKQIKEKNLFSFFERHPLFFFLVQSGNSRDALSLIEDGKLKSEAARLSFRIIESPEITEKTGEERDQILRAMAERYLVDLHSEVTRREKLIALEKSLDEARAQKDRVLEKKLLAEFVNVSGGGSVSAGDGLPS